MKINCVKLEEKIYLRYVYIGEEVEDGPDGFLPSYLTAFSQGIIIRVITIRWSGGTSTLRVISFLEQRIVPEQLRRYK